MFTKKKDALVLLLFLPRPNRNDDSSKLIDRGENTMSKGVLLLQLKMVAAHTSARGQRGEGARLGLAWLGEG